MKNQDHLSGFECTFLEFKEQASQFFRRLKGGKILSRSQIECGIKALGLAFIYMQGTENEKYQSEIVLTLANRKADEYNFSKP